MTETPWPHIRAAYGWPEDAVCRLIHDAENRLYRVETSRGKFALRRYRPNQHGLSAIRAELAWMDALRAYLAVPQVLKTKDREPVLAVSDRHYAAFTWVEGEHLSESPAAYRQLGALMRTFHQASRRIAEDMPKDWPGWRRPRLDRETLVDGPREALLRAEFLDDAFKRRCTGMAEALRRGLNDLEGSHFIHLDIHGGNVIVDRRHLTLLDFDECGFGPVALDLGAARLHPLAAGAIDDVWPAFLEAYGDVEERTVQVGTALRFFYMMGKIPRRQDVAELRREPAKRLES